MLEIEQIDFKYAKIKSIRFNMAKSYKPIWQSLENNRADVNLKIIDRFSPFESIACEWVLSMVYSEMSQFIVPKRGESLRTLAAELQNVLWNINYIKNVLNAIDEKTYSQHALYLRDSLLDLQEMWMGGRVLPQYLTVSGVERDLTVGIAHKLKSVLNSLKKEFMDFYFLVGKDSVLLKRLTKVMILEKGVIQHLNLGGVLAYGSGFKNDIKDKVNYGAYSNLERYVPPASLTSSDAKGRLLVSLDWIKHTFSIIDTILNQLPEGNFDLKERPVYEPLHGHFVSALDAPSGPLYASYIYKKVLMSSTSTRLSPFLEHLLVGEDYEDLNLCIASLGFDVEQGALA